MSRARRIMLWTALGSALLLVVWQFAAAAGGDTAPGQSPNAVAAIRSTTVARANLISELASASQSAPANILASRQDTARRTGESPARLLMLGASFALIAQGLKREKR